MPVKKKGTTAAKKPAKPKSSKSMAKKPVKAKSSKSMAMKGEGFGDFLNGVGRFAAQVGPDLAQKVLIPLIAKKFAGSGTKVAGGGLRLAGQRKQCGRGKCCAKPHQMQ